MLIITSKNESVKPLNMSQNKSISNLFAGIGTITIAIYASEFPVVSLRMMFATRFYMKPYPLFMYYKYSKIFGKVSVG